MEVFLYSIKIKSWVKQECLLIRTFFGIFFLMLLNDLQSAEADTIKSVIIGMLRFPPYN